MIQSQPLKIKFPILPFGKEIPYIYNKKQIEPKNDVEKMSSNELNQKIENNKKESSCDQFKKKRFVEMNEMAELFKFSFYSIFTSRKKFPKKYVILIHNDICINLNLRGVSRNETRSIDLYFAHFAKYSERILLFIKNNKKRLIQRIPELKEILELKS